MHLLAEFRGENIYPIELLATDTKKTIMHAHDGVKKNITLILFSDTPELYYPNEHCKVSMVNQ